MRPQKQLFRHEPHNEIYGDCYRTAFACLLDLPVHEVPHFYQLQVTQTNYFAHFEAADFLASRGLIEACVSWDAKIYTLADVLHVQRVYNPDVYYILGGKSPRGTNHSVIGRGGRIVWDPHPDGGDVVGPLTTGFYEVSFLLPLSMHTKPKGE